MRELIASNKDIAARVEKLERGHERRATRQRRFQATDERIGSLDQICVRLQAGGGGERRGEDFVIAGEKGCAFRSDFERRSG